MAQAQLEMKNRVNNTFFIDIGGQLTVKVWKKGREGSFVTFKKPGTMQSLTIPLDVCRQMLEAQDVILLAGDFIRGLVGVSPEDLPEDSSVNA